MKDFEKQLKGLPRFQADAVFKDKLKQRLHQAAAPKRFSRFAMRWFLGFTTFVLFFTGILMLGGTWIPTSTVEDRTSESVPESLDMPAPEDMKQSDDLFYQSEAANEASLSASPSAFPESTILP